MVYKYYCRRQVWQPEQSVISFVDDTDAVVVLGEGGTPGMATEREPKIFSAFQPTLTVGN